MWMKTVDCIILCVATLTGKCINHLSWSIFCRCEHLSILDTEQQWTILSFPRPKCLDDNLFLIANLYIVCNNKNCPPMENNFVSCAESSEENKCKVFFFVSKYTSLLTFGILYIPWMYCTLYMYTEKRRTNLESIEFFQQNSENWSSALVVA